MGRPRKRQKTDHDAQGADQHDGDPPLPEPVIDPELTQRFNDRANFENVCTGPIAQTIKRASHNRNEKYAPNPTLPRATSQNSGTGSSRTPPYDQPRTPPDGVPISNINYLADSSLWPDFSGMEMLPMPLQDGHRKEHTVAFDPGNPDDPSMAYASHGNPSAMLDLPTVPECPCLPNSYLTLSTLSTLSAFPVSSGTVDTLLSAHRTAKSSIFCTSCPQKFQSGSQNVMFSSVMINVMADHWHRVRKASAQDLRKGFGVSEDAAVSAHEDTPMTDREELEWRTFGYHLIRAHVFGDAPIPRPPDARSSKTPALPISSPMTLMSVLTSFEQRQLQWHDQAPWTGEFPQRFTTDLTEGHTRGMALEDLARCHDAARHQSGDHDFLCVRIVDAAKRIVGSLNTDRPRLEA